MAQPTPYERQFAFSGQPKATWAEGLENELNAVKVTTDETLTNLALIQRDDGALKNRIVTRDSLAPDVALAGLVALDFADEATAVAGAVDDEAMSPLGVKQQIDARIASEAEATAGTPDRLMDAEQTKQFVSGALDSGGIKYTPSGAGGVTAPAVNKLREWVTPAEYGASGDDADLDLPALYDAIATGKEVRLLPGPDLIIDGDSIDNFTDGQTISGYGGALKKTTNTVTTPLFLIDGKKGLKFLNLTLAGAVGSREYLVYTRNSSDLLFQNTIANREGESAAQAGGNTPFFLAVNTARVAIRGGTLRYGQLGIGTGGDPLIGSGQLDGPVQDILIDGVRISETDTEAVDVNHDTQRLWMVNCRSTNIGRRGDSANEMLDIGGSIDGTGSKCTDIWAVNNYFHAANVASNTNPSFRNGSGGVQVKQWSERVYVARNTFVSGAAQAAGTIGARLSNSRTRCIIEDNTFLNFENACQFATSADDTAVRRNTFTGVMDGIAANDIASNAYTNLDLTRNVITAAASATGNGISFRDFDKIDTSGCKISGFLSAVSGFGNGVRVGQDSSGTGLIARDMEISNVREGIVIASAKSTVERNLVKDTVNTGISLVAADSIVRGNRVLSASLTTGSYAINVAATATRGVVQDNFLDDEQGVATMRGIVFAAADGLTVSGNVVRRFTGSRLNGAQLLTNAKFGWNDFGQTGGKTTLTNAAGTVTPWATETTLVMAGTLTADRAITLSSTNATVGYVQRVVRTATGAFNVDVGGLKTLSASGQWCDVKVTSISAGTATWELIGYGTL